MGEYLASGQDAPEPSAEGAGTPDLRGPGPSAAGSDFSSTSCDQVNGSASGPRLGPGDGFLAINGNSDLSRCVVGNSDARVYQVYLIRQQNYKSFEWLIWIDAQGPSGAGSGNMWLRFEDETHD